MTRPRARPRWRTACSKNPDINLVYTINEPAAFGAYTALKNAGKEKDVIIVSVDGGCQGVQGVVDGKIAATSQQYPLKMASMGVEAIVEVRQGRHQALRLHRHRRDPDHRQGAGRRRQQGLRVRPGQLLGQQVIHHHSGRRWPSGSPPPGPERGQVTHELSAERSGTDQRRRHRQGPARIAHPRPGRGAADGLHLLRRDEPPGSSPAPTSP